MLGDVSETRSEFGLERADALRRTTSRSQRSPRHVRRLDCSDFFCIRGPRLGDLCGAGLSLCGGRKFLRAVFCRGPGTSTEQAEVVVETSLSFLRGQLTVLPEFVGDGG